MAASVADRIEVVCGDITSMEVDAIVNAANSRLAGGGGVDGAIHTAAGPQLLAACMELGGCPAGEARLTPAFSLPARVVIHTVGPIWEGGNRDEAKLLASCYAESLRLAAEADCRSIAFPAISCGIYHYPHEDAARIAFETIAEHLVEYPNIERIIMVAYSEDMEEIYDALWEEL